MKALIEKYFEGETSLEEEASLREYFQQETVEESLQMYRPLFQHYHSAKDATLGEEFDQALLSRNNGAKVRTLRPTTLLLRVAAIGLVLAACMLFLYQSNRHHSQQAAIDWSKYEVTDEQVAYDETVKALRLLSSKLHKGTQKASEEVEKIEKVGKYFN